MQGVLQPFRWQTPPPPLTAHSLNWIDGSAGSARRAKRFLGHPEPPAGAQTFANRMIGHHIKLQSKLPLDAVWMESVLS